jgi:Cu(I)/Ag(I) efflux system membrane fusion protein
MQMNAMKIFKILGVVVFSGGLFTAGYFWGQDKAHQEMGSGQPSASSDMGSMKGMSDMPGMAGMNMTPGTAMVNPQMQQLMGVRTAIVEAKTLSKTVRAVGTVTYDESRVKHVHSKVDGWVDKLYVNSTGAFVGKGQPLFSIYSPDLVATQSEYLMAKKNYESLATSSIPEVKTGASSLVAASRARLALWDISEQQLRDLEQKGEAQKTLTLYSPYIGFVIKKDINEGMKVMGDKELYTIADLSSVWVNVDVYESDISFIKLGQRADISLSYSPGESLKGRVSYIYPYLDDKTRTVKVRLEHPNPGYKLKPEMYVNAEIKIPGEAQLSIPEEAVLDSGTRKIVFVDKGDGHFEAKEVKLGGRMDGYFQVLSGLKEGEKIAASSAFLLDSESRLSEAMGAMAGMATESMPGMKDMKMDAPMKSGPMEKKVQDLTLMLSTQPEKTKAGENTLRLKIVDKNGKPVNDAEVTFQYTMAMAGMMVSKAEAKLSKDGFYETKANFGMKGEWEVTVRVRRLGQKEIQEKFKVAAQ